MHFSRTASTIGLASKCAYVKVKQLCHR